MILAKIDFDLMPKCVDFEVYGIDIMRNYVVRYAKVDPSAYLITMGEKLYEWYNNEIYFPQQKQEISLNFMEIEVIEDEEDNGWIFTLYDQVFKIEREEVLDLVDTLKEIIYNKWGEEDD
jgi:hypothetical protein